MATSRRILVMVGGEGGSYTFSDSRLGYRLESIEGVQFLLHESLTKRQGIELLLREYRMGGIDAEWVDTQRTGRMI